MGREIVGDQGWDCVSMDHALWFHRQARVDDWICYRQSAPVAVNGRTLAHADVFDTNGLQLASAAQEGLVYPYPLPGTAAHA